MRMNDFQVSWIRQQDVVVLTHGTLVFTTDSRVKVRQTEKKEEFQSNGKSIH